MNLNLSPVWILLPLVSSILYSYWFYSSKPDFPRLIKIILSIIRGLLVFIIGVLILDPSLRWLKEEEEKPILLFLQDNSESILLSSKKEFYKGIYKENINHFLKDLKNNFEVRSYSFGSGVSDTLPFSFRETVTDLSPALQKIKDQFEGRNIGALVLATDGIFNRGDKPESELIKFHVPIFTLGLGDSASQKDVQLNQVDYNEVVFAGDSFPIQASVSAHNFAGKEITLVLKKGNSQIQRKVVRVHSDNAQLMVPLSLREDLPGNYLYKIELLPLEGESNLKNNSKSLVINVLKSQQKILLLSGITNPDLSAIKQSLSLYNHNKISLHSIDDKDYGNLSQYSALILYQVPDNNGTKLNPILVRQLENLPVLHIVGLQTKSPIFNNFNLSSLLRRDLFPGSRTDILNKDFQLFIMKDSLRDLVPSFPPLNGNFTPSLTVGSENVLAFSIKSGTQDGDKRPLIVLDNTGNKKSAWILGEGIWKWRTFEFAKTGKHGLVDDLLQKIISFLTVTEDKSRFRVISPKSVWDETEGIHLEAEVFNQNFELINQPSVRINLRNKEGKVYPFNFTPEGKSYNLKIGSLPAGTYTYSAQVSGIRLQDSIKSGIIQVESPSLEEENTQADFLALQKLSKESSGEFFLAQDFKNLESKIKTNSNIRPIIHERKGFTSWIDIPLFLGFIIFLLSTEWVLRKWNGFY